jgi:hypothetical protein
MNTTFRPLIESNARRFGVSADMVEAVVLVESSANPWAWNPEPHYRYLWNVRTHQPFRKLTDAERASEVPPTDFPFLAGDRDQEWWGQQASWGLMQVMGAVARENSFDDPYLTRLCAPEVNLAIGCRVLLGLLLWSDGDVKKALGGYNAGRGGWDSPAGRAYATKVLSAMRGLA